MPTGCTAFLILFAFAAWSAYLYLLGRDHGIVHMIREQNITEETIKELEQWLDLAKSLPSEEELKRRPCSECRSLFDEGDERAPEELHCIRCSGVAARNLHTGRPASPVGTVGPARMDPGRESGKSAGK